MMVWLVYCIMVHLDMTVLKPPKEQIEQKKEKKDNEDQKKLFRFENRVDRSVLESKYKEALRGYKNAEDINDSFSSPLQHLKGRVLTKLGKFDAAIKCYGSIIEKTDPVFIPLDVYLERGILSQEKERMREAKLYFEKVIKRCERTLNEEMKDLLAEALTRKAMIVHGKFEEIDRAVKLYKRAISTKPTGSKLKPLKMALEVKVSDAELWYKIGVKLWEEHGLTQEIEHFFERSLKFNRDAKVLEKLADLYHKKKKYGAAIKCYEELKERAPSYPEVYKKEIYPYLELGQLEETLSVLKKYKDLNPEFELDDTTLIKLGNLCLNEEKYDLAVNFLDKVSYRYLDARFQKAMALMDLERYEDAVDVFNSLAKRMGYIHNPEVIYLNRGIAYLEQGWYRDAIKDFDEVLKLKSTDLTAWYNKGVALMNKGEVNRALDILNKVIERTNSTYRFYRDALKCKFWLLREKNQKEKALEAINEALELNPTDAEVLFKKGVTLVELELLSKAKDCFKNAMEVGNGKILKDAKHWLILTSFALEEYDALLEFKDDIKNYQGDVGLTWYIKGYIYSREEKHEKAIEAFKKSLEKGLEKGMGHYSWAIELAKIDEIESAIEHINKASEESYLEYEGYIKKAIHLLKEGKIESAITVLNGAIDSPLDEKLKMVYR